jgi:hypothetical protein
MGIPLFVAEPTGACRLSLRRFRHREDGAGHSHDASVVIDEDAPVTPDRPDGTKPVTDGRVPHDDPRWPACCECGEAFQGDDVWQVNELDWYEGNGQRFAWGIGSWDGPPGAMVRVPWRDNPGRPPAWLVFLPNGTWWCTNDRAVRDEGNRLGPYWTITGTAPQITVSPSIDDRSPSRPWHGWIRDGEFVNA